MRVDSEINWKPPFQKGKFGGNFSAGVLNSRQIPARAPHSEGYGL